MADKANPNMMFKKINLQIDKVQKRQDGIHNQISVQIGAKRINTAVKSTVKSWCKRTTTHGFENISSQRNAFVRAAWIIATLVSFGYMTASLVQYMQLYYHYNVVVKYENVIDAPASFPAVTFCNLNPFDLASDASTGKYISQVLKNHNLSAISILNGKQNSTQIADRASAILKSNVVADSRWLNASEIENLGYSLDQMLISCYFNGIECNASDFTWLRSYEYGNCYTFNGLRDSTGNLRAIKKTSKPGPANGLRLELFIGLSGE